MWVQPASRAAKLFAIAHPTSLCPWNSISQSTTFLTVLTTSYTCLGVAIPTVSAIPTLVTPNLLISLYTLTKSFKFDLKLSSLLNLTSNPLLFMKSITSLAASIICSISFPCENFLKYEDVPNTTSTPLTPVSTAILAIHMTSSMC